MFKSGFTENNQEQDDIEPWAELHNEIVQVLAHVQHDINELSKKFHGAKS